MDETLVNDTNKHLSKVILLLYNIKSLHLLYKWSVCSEIQQLRATLGNVCSFFITGYNGVPFQNTTESTVELVILRLKALTQRTPNDGKIMSKELQILSAFVS